MVVKRVAISLRQCSFGERPIDDQYFTGHPEDHKAKATQAIKGG